MQTISIAEATTAQLVSFYNTHIVRLQDGTKVRKFADRKTAEKRCAKLGDSLASYYPDETDSIPPEGMIFIGELVNDEGEAVEIAAVEVKPVATVLNGDDETEEEEEEPTVNSFASIGAVIGSMSGEKPVMVRTEVGRASNSLGVALSWNVPKVRAERLTRDGVSVSVDGEEMGEFKSTREAFREMKLPDSKHIRFRLKLKEARVADFEHQGKVYTFEIVQIEV